MRSLGIALLGYGGIGRVHALGYRAIPFHYGLPANAVRLVGVATRHPQTAERAAAEIGCPVWTTDYRQLLARDDVDAIDCCLPNDQHEEVVVAAAAAGKHIYCEKPLAAGVDAARRMVAAVQEAGVLTQMTFNYRFFPALLQAKQLVDQGFLGRVFSFYGRYYRSSYTDPQKPLTWRLRKDASGGGALFDLGSHVLDLVYWLLGDFAAVNATLETLVKERPLAPGSAEMGQVDVDDLALLQVRMAGGSLGTVESTRFATGAVNDLLLEVYGERGSLRFSLGDPAWLEVYDAGDTTLRGFRRLETVQRYAGQKAPDWTAMPGFVRTHTECQYQFLRAIWDDRPASPSLADGLAVQEVMDAACRSAATGQWVAIDAPDVNPETSP